MKFSQLGHSPLKVSRVCLGSMTWGLQNNQHDADEQINYALSQGINFIDTAEMYAVPPSPETYGKTEQIIGDWLKRHEEKRHEIVLATKIAGAGLNWVRGGKPINKQAVVESVEQSLKRLQTDYIDVYQLHWPNRTSPHFGKHWHGMLDLHAVSKAQQLEEMGDILEGLKVCLDQGKIRHWGLSNETPWGVNTYLNLCEQHNIEKPVSIQNEFNLLHEKDWPYLLENCVNEDIAYLPWSPLAGGLLTGKYLGGARPEGSRWTLMQRHGLFRDTQYSQQATAAYQEVAHEHHLSTTQLALAWCDQVDGVTSTIIGATSMAQLKENITAFDIPLPPEALAEIDTILKTYPVPF
ncbi:aldo/keto reductase [Pseudoalteromonas luteoviolacea]|uniref:Aldo-keto reductase n=1 Tax=Pseudoalteromonas luteoviolacea S4054 TaxID=1129367 RepID=A0A0F6AA58_9GAMM|nr:aldo/keto reductase [Pseudoalteromonas luteoviolacea]AOT07307.1 aldo/keto reductase [Pseudoalteromonas luteoviolacea]AOT12222.1 aldo/keto reductase [Pseudoalteromonas luteoviolacea]AOT17135.1 aldo/keto reductase [Pseudoalteromonas luteoviolacea]KKE83065.1 aldo-keto reductase [Pseudoalteromonas luteoviolacea S4054]KZN72412.1 aldo-keto reductase [Pseudoalteromonas luteoviolacea S4047-1]